jgi:type IV pilus assembly protein PilW
MTIVTTCMIKPPLGKKAGGFTLVELMVALTIGLFLVIGLISLLVSTSQTRTELDKTSRQIENGRYALQLLTTDVQHAGFLGSYTPTSATSTAPDPCAPAGTDFVATPSVSVPVFIYGYAAATADATPPTCITTGSPAFRLAGTHILVVRRVSTTAIPTGSAVAGETYMQVAACAPLAPPFVVGTGSFSLKQKDCATDAFLRKYIVRMYYVSSCNNCSPSDGIPTLKIVEFVNGAMTVRPLAEGIQSLEVDYGIDVNNDGSPDCYVNNPGSTTVPACAPAPYVWEPTIQNWANVVATRIHVLARNSEPSADWTDTRIYDLGTAGTYTPGTGDKYKRHVYSAVARVVNVASRREQP